MSRLWRSGVPLTSKALFVAAMILGVLCGAAFLGVSSTHHVRARFTDADGLVSGNEVRVAGVAVGAVDSVTVGADGKGGQYAEAVLAIADKDWPLHRGTTVAVRPKGVLSNVFVDLTPSSPASPALPEGYLFDTGSTSSPVNLDELSNVFDPNVRTAIRTQLQEGVLALGGNGATDLNQTIRNLDPLLKDAVPVTDVLAQRVPELDRLNHEFDTISAELAREDAHLRPLIVDADTTLAALASREAQLQGTLVHAAGTLSSLDAGLKGETGNLAAIFQKGPQALAAARSAADYLTPLIAKVNPAIPDLDILLNEFVTASGFNTGTTNGIDTLRVDGSLPPSNRSAQECGGERVEQSSACPNAPQPTTGY